MKLENGEISNSQLMILVFSFLQGMILTVAFVYPVAKHDTWLAVLVCFVITILFTLLYLVIALKFPGQNLVQINDSVFGPYLGKLISVVYIWFFFQYMIHYMYFFNSFWVTFIMPETPRSAFLIMFTFVCAMAVRRGIEVIARCSFLFSIIVTVSVLIVSVLLVKDMKLTNLLPILEIKPIDFVHGVQILLAIPFLDILAFLFIVPYSSSKMKVRKPVLLGLCMSTALLIIVVIRDAAVLGPRLAIVASPSFSAIRQIDIANVLTRLDILLAITLLITIFMKVTVFYYVTVLGFAQMLKLRSYIPLTIPIGALAAAIAARLYESDMEQIYAGIYVWPFYANTNEILIPVITLAVIIIRRLPKKRGGKCE